MTFFIAALLIKGYEKILLYRSILLLTKLLIRTLQTHGFALLCFSTRLCCSYRCTSAACRSALLSFCMPTKKHAAKKSTACRYVIDSKNIHTDIHSNEQPRVWRSLTTSAAHMAMPAFAGCIRYCRKNPRLLLASGLPAYEPTLRQDSGTGHPWQGSSARSLLRHLPASGRSQGNRHLSGAAWEPV